MITALLILALVCLAIGWGLYLARPLDDDHSHAHDTACGYRYSHPKDRQPPPFP